MIFGASMPFYLLLFVPRGSECVGGTVRLRMVMSIATMSIQRYDRGSGMGVIECWMIHYIEMDGHAQLLIRWGVLA